MSALLDSLCGKARLQECARHEGLRLFRVTIDGGEPMTLAYPSAMAAWDDAVRASGPEARIEVQPLSREAQAMSMEERLARHHVVLAELRDEAERIAADVLRNERKGEVLARRNDAHAMDLQIQFQGYIGGLTG